MTIDKIIVETRDEVTQLEAYYSVPLPKRLDKKIRRFISSIFDIDQSKLSLRMRNGESSDFTAMGSMRHLDKAVILIEQDYTEQLIENHVLTKEAKFFIAHEVAHIIHDDCVEGTAHIEEASAKSFFSKPFFTALAAGALVGSIFSPPITAFISLAAALAAGSRAKYVTSCRMNQEQELARDIEAAKKSPEIAEGGILFFEARLRKNQAERSFAFWQKDVAEQHSNPITHTLHALRNTITSRRTIDVDGNYLSDVNHPHLTVRLHTCRQIAEAHARRQV